MYQTSRISILASFLLMIHLCGCASQVQKKQQLRPPQPVQLDEKPEFLSAPGAWAIVDIKVNRLDERKLEFQWSTQNAETSGAAAWGGNPAQLTYSKWEGNTPSASTYARNHRITIDDVPSKGGYFYKLMSTDIKGQHREAVLHCMGEMRGSEFSCKKVELRP